DELEALHGGPRVRAAIESFLAVHGNIGQPGFTIESPAWADEPRLLFVELARQVGSAGDSPAARRARLLADGDALERRTRAILAERRRAFERDRRLRPPRQIGAPPTMPVVSSAIRDLGYRVTQTGRDVLQGVASSPGVGRGPARLVTGPADFERFQRGDILV